MNHSITTQVVALIYNPKKGGSSPLKEGPTGLVDVLIVGEYLLAKEEPNLSEGTLSCHGESPTYQRRSLPYPRGPHRVEGSH